MLTIVLDENCQNIIKALIDTILKDGYKPLAGSDELDFKIKINEIYIKLIKDFRNKRIKYSFDEIIKLFEDKFNKNKILNATLTLISSVYEVNGEVLMRNYKTFNFIK